ncbi:MAG: cyclic nucleotide-binding domain-containing protein [Acidimicrobiales bacterium]
MVLAIDFEPISLGNSTLELLLVLVLLTLAAVVVVTIGTTLASPLVDRKWPADEPLDPTELLWGESSGTVTTHFRGLDLDESKELATQFVETKVPAGEFICEQGDPATHFYVLKEGEAEVLQRIQSGDFVREETIRRYRPGDSFGEVAILRRTARTASIRALTDCVVLQLSAEDFVAGAALSAAEESELLGRVDEYLAADRRRTRGKATPEIGFTRQLAVAQVLEAAAAAKATTDEAGRQAPAAGTRTWSLPSAPQYSTPESPAAPHPEIIGFEAAAATATATGASGWRATHVVPATGLLAWARPDPDAEPSATLEAGVEVEVVDDAGVWRRVVASNGWQGWVDGRTLVPKT